MTHLCCVSKVQKYEPQKRNIILMHNFWRCMVTLGLWNLGYETQGTHVYEIMLLAGKPVCRRSALLFCKLSWIWYQIWPGENFQSNSKVTYNNNDMPTIPRHWKLQYFQIPNLEERIWPVLGTATYSLLVLQLQQPSFPHAQLCKLL